MGKMGEMKDEIDDGEREYVGPEFILSTRLGAIYDSSGAALM